MRCLLTWYVISHLPHFSPGYFLSLLLPMLTSSHPLPPHYLLPEASLLLHGSIFPPGLGELIAVEGCGVLWSRASSSPARRHRFSSIQSMYLIKGGENCCLHFAFISGSWEVANRRGLLEVASQGQEQVDSVLWYLISNPFSCLAVPTLLWVLSDLSV